jgi:hypothetical protein
LLEVRGVGIRRVEAEPVAVVGLVIDLGAESERLPQQSATETTIAGIALPRLGVAAGCAPLPLVLALLQTVAHS